MTRPSVQLRRASEERACESVSPTRDGTKHWTTGGGGGGGGGEGGGGGGGGGGGATGVRSTTNEKVGVKKIEVPSQHVSHCQYHVPDDSAYRDEFGTVAV
ncbi:MAG: hypothetical protein H0T97_00325 [Actinobacteria bacterium]|nr:hypothetical protein [Actinomycetota bacterium]